MEGVGSGEWGGWGWKWGKFKYAQKAFGSTSKAADRAARVGSAAAS